MISITDFKKLTRIEQSFFALPFALSGALLTKVPLCLEWGLLVLAVLLARISGMAFNQLIDRHIDAKNSRTQNRPIPSGAVSTKEAASISWGALILFVALCFFLNPLTGFFSLLAAFLIYSYSYMKRVHWLCHFVLGFIHCFGPIMAYSALTSSFSFTALFLGLASSFLIAGNDIIYATQDYEFDRSCGLHSFPSRFGIKKSLWVACFCHGITLVMLLMLGLNADFPYLYYLLLFVVGTIFILFHGAVRERRVALFAICNASVAFSVLFFLAVTLWLVLL